MLKYTVKPSFATTRSHKTVLFFQRNKSHKKLNIVNFLVAYEHKKVCKMIKNAKNCITTEVQIRTYFFMKTFYAC